MTETAPLDDPTYQPQHPPVDGRVPDVVVKWGAASQLRWFRRFQGQFKPMPAAEWGRFHCESEHHRGMCCGSCLDDYDGGYDYPPEDGEGNPLCCCKALQDD